ncbi:uncharacterized protein LOC125942828 [Dermacentor silvarum]|uniref:uncharacterized protein LOC125942828 n=1 Tax=Dermacentor silvarum TaxID=543639 RepID=UPI002101A6B3|nr:uncharacterized protein LOC125942828 [Dermacentor silvarum]
MGRIFRKKMGQGSDSGSDDEELVPRKHLKKAESKILALQNKLRISEQQRLEERQRNVKLQDLLEERLNSMEASIVQAVKAGLHGARLPSQDNVCREKTSRQVASVLQPEPAMLHEVE